MDPFPFSNIIILFFCFTATIFVYRFVKRREPPLNLPPGPWKLPIIGSILHLVKGGSLPHRMFKNLSSRYGPLMHIQLGEISTIVVSSPQVALEVMKTHDLAFASRPTMLVAEVVFYKCTNIAGARYGAYWRQMRKICTQQLFTTKKVGSFRSIREEETRKFIESIGSISTAVNLSQEIFSLTYKIICSAGFGTIGYQYEGSFKLLMHEIILHLTSFHVGDLFPSLKLLHTLTGIEQKFQKLHQKVDQILDDIIDHHKKQLLAKNSAKTSQPRGSAVDDGSVDLHVGEDDLVDVLLKVAESEGLDIPITYNNIKAVILDIFIGGADTSSTVLEWAMSELIKNPKVLKKAQEELRHSLKGKQELLESDIQDLAYLKLVIKETMRLHPPIPLLPLRESMEHCNINGYDIPVNTKVIINVWAIGRDPQYWDDGECFIPERFENSLIQNQGKSFEYLPFGAGRRMCPGINFGLANVELPLAQMLYHFDWELPNGMKCEDLDMSENFGIVCNRRNALHLVAIPHSA